MNELLVQSFLKILLGWWADESTRLCHKSWRKNFVDVVEQIYGLPVLADVMIVHKSEMANCLSQFNLLSILGEGLIVKLFYWENVFKDLDAALNFIFK